MEQQSNGANNQLPKNTWIIVSVIAITALITGGGVYWWQKLNFEKTKIAMQGEIDDLRQEVSSLNQQVSDLQNRHPSEGLLLTLPNLPLNIRLPEDYDYLPVSIKDQPWRSSLIAYSFDYTGDQEFPYIASIEVFSREEIKKIQEECDEWNASDGMPCLFYYDTEIYDLQKDFLPQKQPYREGGIDAAETMIEYKEFNGRGFFIRTTGKPFANMRHYTTFIDNYLIDITIDANDYDSNLELLDKESDLLFSQVVIEEE